MATAGSYRLRSELRAGKYTPDASSRFRVVPELEPGTVQFPFIVSPFSRRPACFLTTR
jgi:hypothetical protein